MSRILSVIHLPLLLNGLPAAIEEGFRAAGVPAKPFQMAAAIRADAQQAGGEFVISDSRCAAARADAKTAAFYGLTVVDVADLLSSTAPEEFLLRLKKRIENLGGPWVRIGDFPFPHEAVELTGRLPADDPLARLTERIQAESTRRPPTGLTWRATCAEFKAWWRHRYRIELQVEKRNQQYRVQCAVDDGRPEAALEIWRGEHVAVVPLRPGKTTIPEEGLVFQQARLRNPAGSVAAFGESAATNSTSMPPVKSA